MNINAQIIGVGASIPDKQVTNDMLSEFLDTSDKWIKRRTGISTRHVAITETTTSMAIDASKSAIKSADIDPNSIDIIIGTTVSSEYATPAIANIVQKEISCDNAVSFDIAVGCTGFVYALTTMVSMMDTLNLETGLLVSSENMTGKVDWDDRGSCVLFGDGAGAVIVKRCDQNKIKYPVLKSIVDTNDVLYIENNMCKTPWSEKQNKDAALKMKGSEVYEFAIRAFNEVLDEIGEKMGDEKIDKIVPHQANSRIINYVAKTNKYDLEQFFINVDKCANTSSASIPIALYQAHNEGWLKYDENIALIAFGAGLSYGGIVIKWAIK